MHNEIEVIERNGRIAKIFNDEDPMSPMEWDNAGHIVCFHRNYNLGDKNHGFSSPEDFIDYLKTKEGKEAIVLPVYAYEHGNITIKTGPFSCPWDSGQIGWIYCTKQEAKKEWGINLDGKDPNRGKGTRNYRKACEKYLKARINEYDQYLTGDVYGYIIEDSHGNELDSCWGFYGMEHIKEEINGQFKYYEKKDKENKVKQNLGMLCPQA